MPAHRPAQQRTGANAILAIDARDSGDAEMTAAHAAQDRPSVEHYARRGEQWILTVVTDLDATVRLPAIDAHLRLREVYRRANAAGRGAGPEIGRASCR